MDKYLGVAKCSVSRNGVRGSKRLGNPGLETGLIGQSVISKIKHRRIAMAWTCAEDGPIPYPQNRLEMDFTWKRKPGRLKSTWRRTVEAELKELNISCRANKVHSKGQEHMERNQGSLMSQQGKEDNSSKKFGFSF